MRSFGPQFIALIHQDTFPKLSHLVVGSRHPTQSCVFKISSRALLPEHLAGHRHCLGLQFVRQVSVCEEPAQPMSLLRRHTSPPHRLGWTLGIVLIGGLSRLPVFGVAMARALEHRCRFTIGLTNGRAVYVFINCGRVVDGHCSPLLPALTRGAVHQTHHDSNSVESASGE